MLVEKACAAELRDWLVHATSQSRSSIARCFPVQHSSPFIISVACVDLESHTIQFAMDDSYFRIVLCTVSC